MWESPAGQKLSSYQMPAPEIQAMTKVSQGRLRTERSPGFLATCIDAALDDEFCGRSGPVVYGARWLGSAASSS